MQGGMPPFAYAIIAGVVVVMIIVMVIGMKKSFARAKGATDKMTEGLQRMGLQIKDKSMMGLTMEGHYRGRAVALQQDSSKATKAGFTAAIGGIAGGILGADDVDEKAEKRINKSKLKVRWMVALPLESPVRVVISHDADDENFQEIGQGLYARFDPPAQAALSNPQVVAALAAADFDKIVVKGKAVSALWFPAMAEYQKKAASPEKYTDVSRRAFDAITTLCDGLYGPAQQVPMAVG